MKKSFRGFVAIDIPKEIHHRLRAVKKELEKAGDSIRPTEDENLHITMKFLGDIGYDDIAKIENALLKIAAKTKRIKVKLRGVGVFPNESYIRVVWIGCKSKDNSLKELSDRINEGIGELGFPREENTPHLTIARVKRRINLLDFLAKYKNADFGEFEVTQFFLKQSILGRDTGKGPKYETIVEVALE